MHYPLASSLFVGRNITVIVFYKYTTMAFSQCQDFFLIVFKEPPYLIRNILKEIEITSLHIINNVFLYPLFKVDFL